MSPADRWRILHMVEAAEQALAFVRNRQRTDLEADPMRRLALTRAIEILGEAAAQVSDSARIELDDIPWPQIVGMRNRLVHAYFDINLDILWDTVHLALPPLIARLKPAIAHASPDLD
ncbi:HepT-like ribonuclease domain-containing protein [Sulfuricystis thermophila]|uniref:HepT-like ribonuclease domain-containing protein n=1 Tax=Sulfuricystis thermophila TaxID=2496847 RepID=UPI001036ED42|nr:HepT-like ribonuclease domain-containing protein [Sulfuricystis thermophila]